MTLSTVCDIAVIAERLAPSRTPACLGLFGRPAEIAPFATGEAA